MPSKRANVKHDRQYEALKDKGMSTTRAAKIANSPGASKRGSGHMAIPSKWATSPSQFAQSTLENWQSEFLQLFAVVSLANLFVFKGSAESEDTEEKLEASLRRVEEALGSLPDTAPSEPGKTWKLPHPEHDEPSA